MVSSAAQAHKLLTMPVTFAWSHASLTEAVLQMGPHRVSQGSNIVEQLICVEAIWGRIAGRWSS